MATVHDPDPIAHERLRDARARLEDLYGALVPDRPGGDGPDRADQPGGGRSR